MPEKFDACRKAGGKIRTKKIGSNKYMHICMRPGSNKSVAGHIKKKKRRD